MALTNNNLEIIKALAHNDLYTARKAALASLIEDKTKKNEWAVTDIAAETEEDAIAIARNKRYSYGVTPKEELYTAQRAEFLVPQNKGI